MIRKPYPKNGLEQDITYARSIYKYPSKSGLTKWVKRQMNKRFRRKAKIKLIKKVKNKNYENNLLLPQ